MVLMKDGNNLYLVTLEEAVKALASESLELAAPEELISADFVKELFDEWRQLPSDLQEIYFEVGGA